MDNIAKNNYVKSQITNALIDILKAKELRDISISEVTNTAEVSRISFYRNYSEKEDVLREYIEKSFGNWLTDHNQGRDYTEDEMLGNIFAYLTDNKGFYLLLSSRNLLYLLKDMIKGICGPKKEYPNFVAYTTAFISNGIYGWIEEWFLRGMQETGEEMTALLKSRDLNPNT